MEPITIGSKGTASVKVDETNLALTVGSGFAAGVCHTDDGSAHGRGCLQGLHRFSVRARPQSAQSWTSATMQQRRRV